MKTQISLGIHPDWSESSLCTQWVAKDPSFLHSDLEDYDQTGPMPRLIWVFPGRTCHFVDFVRRRLIFNYVSLRSSKIDRLCPAQSRAGNSKVNRQTVSRFSKLCVFWLSASFIKIRKHYRDYQWEKVHLLHSNFLHFINIYSQDLSWWATATRPGFQLPFENRGKCTLFSHFYIPLTKYLASAMSDYISYSQNSVDPFEPWLVKMIQMKSTSFFIFRVYTE